MAIAHTWVQYDNMLAVTATSDLLTSAAAHNLTENDQVKLVGLSNLLSLSTDVAYYVSVQSPNTFKLKTHKNTDVINIAGDGEVFYAYTVINNDLPSLKIEITDAAIQYIGLRFIGAPVKNVYVWLAGNHGDAFPYDPNLLPSENVNIINETNVIVTAKIMENIDNTPETFVAPISFAPVLLSAEINASYKIDGYSEIYGICFDTAPAATDNIQYNGLRLMARYDTSE